MPRVAYKNEALLNAITEARQREKEAKEEARNKLAEMVDREVEPFHKELISAIRMAVLDGVSARQIGKAYGSSDANTVKALVEEALDGSIAVPENVSGWEVEQDGDRFTVKAISLGNDKFTGQAVFEVDDDGENITAVSGDLALQAVLYRMNLVPTILRKLED